MTEHDPGFTFSGPLRLPLYDGRKKTFFFTAYEYDTILDSATIDTLVPIQQNPLFTIAGSDGDRPGVDRTASPRCRHRAVYFASVSTPVKNHMFTTRIDHKFSDLHNGSVLYQLGRQNNLRQFGGGNRLAEALLGKTRNTDAISYTDNYVISADARQSNAISVFAPDARRNSQRRPQTRGSDHARRSIANNRS